MKIDLNHPAFLRGIAGVGGTLAFLFAVIAVRSPLVIALRAGAPLGGLLIGTDRAENRPHSDTLMLWRYDPRRPRLDLLSIPRDTKINLPGYRFHRINEVFAYHYGATGRVDAAFGFLREALVVLLPALMSLEPTYYFGIDYDGFRRLVDRLGGVTLRVDEPMHYDDNAGDYHFHREPGFHWFGGDEALGYVRFRGKSGDRGRILRQMEFTRALLSRAASPGALWRWPAALREVGSAVLTNFSVWDTPFLLLETKRWSVSDINPWLLPGRPRGVYWEVNPERAQFVVSQILNKAAPEPFEMADESEEEGFAPAAGKAPTVKVWNASGRVGLALDVARRLRQAGFDVVEWGNYNARQNKSRVIDRSGRFDRAQAVSSSLGMTDPYSDADPQQRTDVEVVLGEDFFLKR